MTNRNDYAKNFIILDAEDMRRLMYGKPVPVDTTEYYPSLILLTEDGFTNLQAFLEGGDSID